MKFEDELKLKLKTDKMEDSKRYVSSTIQTSQINNDTSISSEWGKLLHSAGSLIWFYAENYTQLTPDEITKKEKEFCASVSNESLNQMKKSIELTPEERLYLQYNSGAIFYQGYSEVKPISKILLRRMFIDCITKLVGEKNIDFKALKESSLGRLTSILEIVAGDIFVTQEQFDKKLAEQVDLRFNQRINCGGYALELDTFVVNHCDDFEKAVSDLLNKVPFIRLLGDTKLGDDEYYVLWRFQRKGGHHFVKIQDDGTVIEKDGCDPIREFSGWSNLENCPEAVFAVKKEHDRWIHHERFESICIDGKKGMNFEQTVQQAVQEQKNSFEYHNHSYSFKKGENEMVFLCSEGRIIADVFIEDGDCDVDIRMGEERYVSNTQPTQPLQIKDGKLQNRKDDEGR